MKNGINIKLISSITVLVVLVAGFGCNNKTGSHADGAELAPDKSMVVARVNGSSVTKNELDEMLVRMFGKTQASRMNNEARKEALDSMILSHLMTEISYKEMTPAERSYVERQVQEYRGTLYSNYYLKKHATIEPVADYMVQEYYERHPEKFGAKSVRRYEMIYGGGKLPAATRKNVLKNLVKIKSNKNWEQQIKTLSDSTYKFYYRQGDADESVMLQQLRKLIGSLCEGEASDVTFIEGKPYLVRILSIVKIAPKPLSEVEARIRKSLVPVQMKKTLKVESEKLMKSAKIEILIPGEQTRK